MLLKIIIMIGFIIILQLICLPVYSQAHKIHSVINKKSTTDQYTIKDFYITFNNFRSILLSSKKELKNAPKHMRHYGINPSTVQVKYLKANALAYIAWETYSLGSGGYVNGGQILVSFTNDIQNVLFRDFHHLRSKAGFGAQSRDSIDLTEHRGKLILSKNHFEYIQAGANRLGFIPLQLDNALVYYLSWTHSTQWEIQTNTKELTFNCIKNSITLKDKYPYPEIEFALKTKLKVDANTKYITGTFDLTQKCVPYRLGTANQFGGNK